MAHTPGPWHFNGRRITTGAFIVADIWNADEPVGQGNAALIAAAPELLHAAREVLQTLLPDYPDTAYLCDVLGGAITKAEGRQP